MRITTRDEEYWHVRELWLDDDPDQAACKLTVLDLPIRIGSAVVRMAGIGGVHTRWEHRMKGYMRALFEDNLQYMVDEGYDVSMLFGIENFYTKFGYASSLADSICKVKTRDAEAAGARAHAHQVRACKARTIEEEDMPAVRALYNAHNATRTCSIVRTPENFAKIRKGTWWGILPEAMMLEGDNGELLAYALWDDNAKAVKVAEVESRDDALFPTLLSILAEQAITKRCEDIELHLPPDHPFSEFAQRFGAKWEIEYPRYGAGMMRIVNQQPLFEKTAPELERRLAVSPLAGFDGTVALCTDVGTTSLAFAGGKLVVGTDGDATMRLELSQDKLVQLLVGYRSVRDVVNEPDVNVSNDARVLLNVLFPRGFPYVWKADHF